MKTTVQKILSRFDVSARSLSRKTTDLKVRTSPKAPIVLYSPLAYQKIMRTVGKCPKEVGWFGTVDTIKDGYVITDIFVPPQIVTATETDIKADALADIAALVEDPEKLYYWGHSHVNMAVAPSGQDETQTEEYLDYADIFIRGIYNKQGDSKVDVFDTAARVVHECVIDLPLVRAMDKEQLKAFDESIKVNVKEPIRPVYQASFHNNPYQNRLTTHQKANTTTHQVGTRSRKNPFVI